MASLPNHLSDREMYELNLLSPISIEDNKNGNIFVCAISINKANRIYREIEYLLLIGYLMKCTLQIYTPHFYVI